VLYDSVFKSGEVHLYVLNIVFLKEEVELLLIGYISFSCLFFFVIYVSFSMLLLVVTVFIYLYICEQTQH